MVPEEIRSTIPEQVGPRLYTIEEMLALPPKKWLVKGVLGINDFVLLFGLPSTGKSFLALEIALRIAEGKDLFGYKIKSPGAVLYVAAEGANGFSGRLAARKASIGLAIGLPCQFLKIAPDLSKPKGVQELLNFAHQLSAILNIPISLIVIDTLNRCFGGGDENTSDAMGAFITGCDCIRRETGATVLVCHHAGKVEKRGARGHSSLKAAVDTEIQIKKIGKQYEAKITKQKDGLEGHFATFKLKRVDLDPDEDGDPNFSCIVEIIGAGQKSTKQNQCAKKIKENPDWTDAKVAEAISCDRSLVTKVRNKIEKEPDFGF